MPEWRPLRQKLRLFLSPLRPALQALTPAFPSELLSVLFVPSTRNTHPPSFLSISSGLLLLCTLLAPVWFHRAGCLRVSPPGGLNV